jgi:hypothetical protein
VVGLESVGVLGEFFHPLVASGGNAVDGCREGKRVVILACGDAG